jgi:hypothetical protein
MFKHSFQLKHPTTVLVAGPTQAGKTEFVINLLKNRDNLISPKPDTILWAQGHRNENQVNKIIENVPNVEFFDGVPTLENIDPTKNNILVLDDLMDEIGKNSKCANLFTRGSHHDNVTVIAIIHNLFNQQKHSRTISLNTRYYVLFKSPRDNQQIEHFGRQIFPHNKYYLASALQQATKKPFGYLIVDLHPQTPDTLRVCSGIFPGELPLIYSPKT